MPAGTDHDVVAVARDLYGLPLGDFTTERNARARAARAAGDRDLAARITALPKPSASAWLVDRFVREDQDDLARVLDLGARLRREQAAPDRTRLRDLGAERRALLAELAERAAEGGTRPSAAVLEEFQQTLLAAMADEDAAAAVRTGRLVRALAAEGLDPVDLTNAVAIADRLDAVDGTPSSSRRRTPAEEQPDEVAEQRARRRTEAEARAGAAERAARIAGRDAADAADRAEEADATRQQRADAVDDLHAQLDALRARAEQAEADLAAADREVREARAAADDAEQEADRTRAEADAAAAALDALD